MSKYKVNITKKVIIYLLLACFLPIMIFGIFMYNKTDEIFKNEINKFSFNMLRSKEKNLNLIMENVESLIINISSLDAIRNGLVNDYNDSSYKKLSAQAQIGYILSGYSNLNGLVSIDLFSINGTHYHVGDTLNYSKIDKDLEKRIFHETMESEKMVVWNGIEDNVNENSSYKKVITASKVIKIVDSDTIQEKPIGIILVNYDIEAFTQDIEHGDFSEEKCMIIDSKNRIVFYPDKRVIGTRVTPSFGLKLNNESDSFVEDIDGKKMIVTYIKNDKNWKIVNLMPQDAIASKTSTISKNISYLIIVCFILLSIFTLIISKKYLQPIKKITELFKKYKDGSLDDKIRLVNNSNDEIGELVLWFNSFMESLYHRKLAEEKLYRSREQYKSVVNNIKEVIFQTDIEGNWTFLNPAWTEITGYSVEESTGKNCCTFILEEDKQKNKEFLNYLMNEEKGYCKQIVRFKTDKDNYRWIEVFARLIYNSEGKKIGTSGTLIDITERVNMEKEIIERERLLECIADATNVLLETTDNNLAFNTALQIIGKVYGVDRVYIFENFTDENRKVFTSLKYEWCRDGIKTIKNNHFFQQLSYKEAGILNWYNKLRNHNIISGPVKYLEENESNALKLQGILSLLIVPIFIDNNFWGFIGLDESKIEKIWSHVEEDSLKAAAASIGGAINRIKAEETLQNLLKDDFKKTVQNLQNLIFKLELTENGDPFFTLFEGRIAQRIGLNTRSIYGKIAEDIMDKHNTLKFNKHLEQALKGQASSFDLFMDGYIYYVTLSPIVEDNSVREVVGSAIDVTAHRKAEEKIKHLAYYDTLTGLPNRSFFTERFYNVINMAKQTDNRVCIMFFDLDRFKLINDTLGHEVGDELIKEVALRLKSCTEKVDIVARMGGDEFTILFSEISDKSEISIFAQEILDSFKQSFIIGQYELFITTSIGISCYPDDGSNIDTLLKNADIAMYKAKDSGSNTFKFFDSKMNTQTIDRLKMENHLRKAIENNELSLKYQPKVKATTEKITGCEALLRWNNPGLGEILPGDFIGLAEETGLIIPIGEWVLTNACKQIKSWHNEGYKDLKVSVNISAKQLQQHNFVEIVSNILSQTKLECKYLELEITENSIMRNTEMTLGVINKLKEIGVQISIDDFGTGFSSMAYLKRFAVDKLKIDRSFIMDINTNKNDAAIASAIISMAHTLNLRVVAEGVETQEQLLQLRKYQCDEIQGFLFGKPMGVKEFRSYLKNEVQK